MSKEVPNVNAMGAYAAVGGALFVMGVGTALGEGIKAGIWSARENSILKHNAKMIAEMQTNVRILREQTQTLLNRMIENNERYPELTKEMSVVIMIQHSLDIDEANENLSHDGFVLVKRLREIGLKMVEDIKELDLSAHEEFLLELEDES